MHRSRQSGMIAIVLGIMSIISARLWLRICPMVLIIFTKVRR